MLRVVHRHFHTSEVNCAPLSVVNVMRDAVACYPGSCKGTCAYLSSNSLQRHHLWPPGISVHHGEQIAMPLRQNRQRTNKSTCTCPKHAAGTWMGITGIVSCVVTLPSAQPDYPDTKLPHQKSILATQNGNSDPSMSQIMNGLKNLHADRLRHQGPNHHGDVTPQIHTIHFNLLHHQITAGTHQRNIRTTTLCSSQSCQASMSTHSGATAAASREEHPAFVTPATCLTSAVNSAM